MTNPVSWFEIYVDDMPRAKQFYETVIGTELNQLSDPNDGNVGRPIRYESIWRNRHFG